MKDKLKTEYSLIKERLKTINSLMKDNKLQKLTHWYDKADVDSLTKDDIRDILPKNNQNFSKIIEELGGKLIYINSGSTGHTFRGVDVELLNIPSYALKVVAYPRRENYGDVYCPNRPENVELLILSVLSQFVLKNQTPHIILPICTFNTSIKPFVETNNYDFTKKKKYKRFIDRYKKNDYYNNVSILISEWAHYGDLMEFLKKKYHKFTLKHWQTLFFQILSVLAVIHKKYPSFRHNDMKANNILVDKVPIIFKSKNYFKYTINNQCYDIPNLGFNIKLWDFDFASIDGLISNSKVNADWTSKININAVQNRYYDMHYFFNTLTKKFMTNFFNDKKIHQEVKDFINRIIPKEYREIGKYISEGYRILINDEIFTPDFILKNDIFFKDFRI